MFKHTMALAVAAMMMGMQAAEIGQELLVGNRPGTVGTITPCVVARGRHAEHAADGADRPVLRMLGDEAELHLGVSEKMPMAFFKMSRSVRTRSSSRRSRATSAA